MIKIGDKLYSFVALFFVFFSILGYQLVTTALLPISSDVETVSHTVTYPYRALMFVLSFFLIMMTPTTMHHKHNNSVVMVYLLFMLIYFVRILIDIFVRGVYIQPGFQTTVIQYIFIAMIPSIWAIAKCAYYIDYEKLNQWLMIGGVLLLGVTVFNHNTLIASNYTEMKRSDGNLALNSIDFGHTCVTLFVIFLSWIVCHKVGKWTWKAILVFLMVLSIILMLRAASRGPLVTFLFLFLFFMFSRMKNKLIGLMISAILLTIVMLNLSSILEWLSTISPMMGQRMSATVFENDSSGRDVLYAEAFDLFFQNPIIGKQFVLNTGMYSHNSILDVMIGLGFFGVLVWIYLIWKDIKIVYKNVLNSTTLLLIGLLSLQFIIKGLFSGALYLQNDLAICMLIVLSSNNKTIQC